MRSAFQTVWRAKNIKYKNMSESIYTKTELLIGAEATDALKRAAVLVLGLGGVGGYVTEALVRAGVGKIGLLDADVFCESNLNRQILATRSSLNRKKTEVAARRIADVNPDCIVDVYDIFYLPETADKVNFSDYSYIVDAVDTVTAKLEIIKRAKACGVPVISCMGTGNKVDVAFKVADISQTKVCPLARVMRKELAAADISGVKCVYSEEKPYVADGRTPASISYAPAIAGLIMAKEVIADLIEKK